MKGQTVIAHQAEDAAEGCDGGGECYTQKLKFVIDEEGEIKMYQIPRGLYQLTFENN